MVSVYPALTAAGPADPATVREVYSRLHETAGIGAVELPLDAEGRIPDEALVLSLVPAHWDVVLTTVPGTLARVGRNPNFGLASPDSHGGGEAVDHLRRCWSTAARIDSALGRRAVRGIQVVSAPRIAEAIPAGIPPGIHGEPSGTAAARLLERLTDILEAAAEDVPVLVEHCDAEVPGRLPAKGFLDISDEIEVVAALRAAGRTSTGLVVNWGRSALETRSAGGPVDHVDRARRAGVLTGVILSGCTDRDGAFGPAWADAHPPLRDLPAPAGEPTSLLTDEAVRSTLDAAGPLDLVGVKVAVRPHDLTPAERAAAIERNVERIAELVGAAP